MSKASRARARAKYLAWQDARYPEATEEEKRAMHDAHKAAMRPWRELRERYAEMEMRPLRVVAQTAAPVVHYDAPHLDSVLAWAVLMAQTQGMGAELRPRYVPLPLQVAGFYGSNKSLPLWRCSIFTPVGAVAHDVAYIHKRAPGARHADSNNIRTSEGRYIERRVPLPTQNAPAWEAFCYGNAAEVEQVLRHVRYLGKRRSNGFGEVAAWRVEAWEGGDPLVRDGALAHAIPAEHGAYAIA
jgi:hypothetical protein